MSINNPPKWVIVLASLASITYLMASNTIDSEAGVGLLGLIVGYGIGNGIAARNDQPVEPLITHRHHDE